MAFDVPNVSVEKKSNEQNMTSLKLYLSEMSEELNYQINQINSNINELKLRVEALERSSE